MQRFRGGLVFKAHRRLFHSNLGLRVITKEEEEKPHLFVVEEVMRLAVEVQVRPRPLRVLLYMCPTLFCVCTALLFEKKMSAGYTQKSVGHTRLGVGHTKNAPFRRRGSHAACNRSAGPATSASCPSLSHAAAPARGDDFWRMVNFWNSANTPDHKWHFCFLSISWSSACRTK